MDKVFAVPRIAVTGSSGKTSTVLMLQSILHQHKRSPAALDTWKGPAAFAKLINSSDADGCLAAEVPLEALRQRQVNGDLFNAAVLTNLSVDHLTACRTPEHYYQEKSRFFQQLSPGTKVILNGDDRRALTLAGDGQMDTITYAINDPNAMVVANNIRHQNFSCVFQLSLNTEITSFSQRFIPPQSATVKLPMIGQHNVSNALAAATLALLLDFDLQAIATSLSRFPGIRRNMEVISSGLFSVIDDAARNPASLEAALQAAHSVAKGRLLILHGLYGGAGQTINRCNAQKLSEWLERYPDSHFVVTRGMYHTKNKFQVRLTEEKAFLGELRKHRTDAAYFPDLPDAVESILYHASSGDLILLLGGPVLDRGREFMLQALGEQRANLTLIPSGLTGTRLSHNGQTIAANPS